MAILKSNKEVIDYNMHKKEYSVFGIRYSKLVEKVFFSKRFQTETNLTVYKQLHLFNKLLHVRYSPSRYLLDLYKKYKLESNQRFPKTIQRYHQQTAILTLILNHSKNFQVSQLFTIKTNEYRVINIE